MTPVHDIEHVLDELVGVPLSGIGRAASMGIFAFGDDVEFRSAHTGETLSRSRYALHLQCPFRVSNQHGVLLGSQDMRWERTAQPQSATSPSGDGETRYDARAAAIEAKLARDPLRVETVSATPLGDIRLCLSHGITIEAFVMHSHRDESWRLLVRPDVAHYVFEAGELRVERGRGSGGAAFEENGGEPPNC